MSEGFYGSISFADRSKNIEEELKACPYNLGYVLTNIAENGYTILPEGELRTNYNGIVLDMDKLFQDIGELIPESFLHYEPLGYPGHHVTNAWFGFNQMDNVTPAVKTYRKWVPNRDMIYVLSKIFPNDVLSYTHHYTIGNHYETGFIKNGELVNQKGTPLYMYEVPNDNGGTRRVYGGINFNTRKRIGEYYKFKIKYNDEWGDLIVHEDDVVITTYPSDNGIRIGGYDVQFTTPEAKVIINGETRNINIHDLCTEIYNARNEYSFYMNGSPFIPYSSVSILNRIDRRRMRNGYQDGYIIFDVRVPESFTSDGHVSFCIGSYSIEDNGFHLPARNRYLNITVYENGQAARKSISVLEFEKILREYAMSHNLNFETTGPTENTVEDTHQGTTTAETEILNETFINLPIDDDDFNGLEVDLDER